MFTYGRGPRNPKNRRDNVPVYYGIMIGQVVDNADPGRRGGILVRVFCVHGNPDGSTEYIPSEGLTRAYPAALFNCGEDFGTFIVPVPGLLVWLFAENNDINKLYYFGVKTYSMGGKAKTMNQIAPEIPTPLPVWKTDPEKEGIPFDVFAGKGAEEHTPLRHVIYKSQKGHTILFDDTDGEEALLILDRLGQVIKFDCPVSKADNEGRYSRGVKSALTDDQLDKSDNPSILFKSGQTLKKKISSWLQIFLDKVHLEVSNKENDKRCFVHMTEDDFLQKTKDAEMETTEDSIRFEIPDVKTTYTKEGYKTTAFEDGEQLMDKDKVQLKKGESFVLLEKDKVTVVGPKKVYVKSDEEAHIEVGDCLIRIKGDVLEAKNSKGTLRMEGESIQAKNSKASFGLEDNSITASTEKSKLTLVDDAFDVKIGQASISVHDDMVYISGKEVHFNEQ